MTYTTTPPVTYQPQQVPQPIASDPPHPDDLVVDHFAKVMKDKLARSRAKGRSGWQACSAAQLSAMLREHVDKGDPVDVANFAMFIYMLGRAIEPAEAANDPSPAADDLASLVRLPVRYMKRRHCTCAACWPSDPINDPPSYRMVLCATCGNKRCPHANDHRLACTGSNEPGQPGSAYALCKPASVATIEQIDKAMTRSEVQP